MRKKKSDSINLNDQELQLIQRLREHPHMFERFRSILEITSTPEGTLKTAGEVEGRLVEETQRLGNAAMSSWATDAEMHVAQEFKKEEPSARVHKKKR